MGWRFRKRIKIAPGVNLNVSKNGVSTTIGGKGASINVGKNGTYLNTGIPGTGIYSRQKLSGNIDGEIKTDSGVTKNKSDMANSDSGFWGNFIGIVLILVGVIGIVTGNSVLMIAPAVILGVFILFLILAGSSIKTVKPENFLAMTDDNSCYEKNHVSAAEGMLEEAKDERIKLLLNGLINFYRKDNSGSNDEEAIAGTDLDEKQIALYKEVIEAFDNISKCDKIWFVTSAAANSEIKSSASITVERKPTAFAFQTFNHVPVKGCDKVPMFRDLEFSYYIYPQFIVKAKNPVNFEVIPIEKVDISYSQQRFVESAYEWDWPKDGQVVDHTYQYVNRDGSPDRRYTLNKQVPVYLYGKISFEPMGLTYHTSKAGTAEIFRDVFWKLKLSMSTPVVHNKEDLDKNSTEKPQPFSFATIPNDADSLKVDMEHLDPMFVDAARLVVTNQYGSTSLIQRKLAIGYNRAGRLIDQLEMAGIVGPPKGANPRAVLIKDMLMLENKLSELKNVSRKTIDIIPSESSPSKDIISHRIFSEIELAAKGLNDYIGMIEKDARTQSIFASTEMDIKQALNIFLLKDIVSAYKELGHAFTLETLEGQCLAVVEMMLAGMPVEYEVFHSMMTYNAPTYAEFKESTIRRLKDIDSSSLKLGDNGYNIINLVAHDKELQKKYLSLLYRYMSLVIKIDNVISEKEIAWLNSITQQRSFIDKSTKQEEITEKKEAKITVQSAEAKDPIAELNKLIGLASVKTEINYLSNLVKIQKMRESRGMKTSNISYHCVFTGNPGTGKTTVARIVADIYKQLGVLKSGHLVETDRSGLVAEYVGQTAPKTNAIIDKAIDGVLFIDEAYSLVQGGQNDFGKEAISTLLKRMEDDRDRLVVILAGYSKEMSDFINSNSGLQSRFNRYIDFPDYSSEELLQIFQFIMKNNDCVATDAAIEKVRDYIVSVVSHKDQNFGNARFIRNLFEKVITQQANRLTLETSITNEMLSRIEEEDISNAVN